MPSSAWPPVRDESYDKNKIFDKRPRFGPGSFNIGLKTLFKSYYGYEMDII